MTREERLNNAAEWILELKARADREPRFFNNAKRSIQVQAWDVSKTKDLYTGMITENAMVKGAKKTMEHHYSSTEFAKHILSLKTISVDIILHELKDKMTWNWTTPEENMILRSNGQNYDDPRISKLVKDPKFK